MTGAGRCVGCWRDPLPGKRRCAPCAKDQAEKQRLRDIREQRRRDTPASIATRNAVAAGFRRYHRLSAKKPGASGG